MYDKLADFKKLDMRRETIIEAKDFINTKNMKG